MILQDPARTDSLASTEAGHAQEAAARVLRQFRMVFSAVRRHFQKMEKLAGIGGAQVWALGVIAAQPGIGMSALAREMDIHPSTASNLIRGLARQGLVQVDKAQTDRRLAELYLLPEGQKILRKVPRPYTGLLPHALSELDVHCLVQLERQLAILLERLQVDEASAQTPLAMM
jgi:DNA-binding MarR family transcriptional regulator